MILCPLNQIQASGNDKFSTTHSNKCWRNCGPQIGDQTHILWLCPKLKAFWKEVFETLQNKKNKKSITKRYGRKRQTISLTDTTSKQSIQCITVRWLKPGPPTHNVWTETLKGIHQMEQITYSLRLQKQKHIFTKSTTIYPCRYSKDVHRTKCKN